MTGITVVFTAFCVVFGAMFTAMYQEGRFRRAFWVKGLAGVCFVAVGLSLTPERLGLEYPRLIFFGLVMGLIGDELLAMRHIHAERKETYFVCGALAFAVGHAFYLRAMLGVDPGAWLFALPVFALGLALAGAYVLRQRIDAGRLFVPGICYIALVVAVAAMAIALLLRGQGTLGLLLTLGGVSFAVSDCVLCVYCFGAEKTLRRNIIVHATYYAAQLLIAWSIAAIS